ncbi:MULTISPECIES: hypothetical protein [Streptomyces]|uniref:Uncharacterized protein n=1 Tax=Streptomyces lycii TaxID=2654337 RepID=A0ABQ7FD69_9ACTN|nr:MULTISPECIES: hypothetical protein [Streptomyces]KAF4406235.1 hypothetical protein GCU69_26060 [Streptomyces lycii]PGH52220.1 hypothetical protein CRI70_02465 [Streptomyces sp. Ru87]
MASDEVRRLARIRMQATGETFEKALAALEGRPHQPAAGIPQQAPGSHDTPRDGDGAEGPGENTENVVLLRSDSGDRESGG